MSKAPADFDVWWNYLTKEGDIANALAYTARDWARLGWINGALALEKEVMRRFNELFPEKGETKARSIAIRAEVFGQEGKD